VFDEVAFDLHLDPAKLLEKALEGDRDRGVEDGLPRFGSYGAISGGSVREVDGSLTSKPSGMRRTLSKSSMEVNRESGRELSSSIPVESGDPHNVSEGRWPVKSSSHFFSAVLASPSVPRRRVTFANEIEKVVVFEVDNATFVDVQFKRNPIGWLLALLICFSFIAFDLYEKLRTHHHHDSDMLYVWTALWRIVLFLVFSFIAQLLAQEEYSMLRAMKSLFVSKWTFLAFFGQGIAYGGQEFCRVLAERLDSGHEVQEYGPSTTFFLLLFLIFRYMRSEETFHVEWVCSSVLLSTSFIATVPMWQDPISSKGVFAGNVLWMLYSICAVIFLFILERTRRATESVLVRVLPSIVGSLLWNTLYSWYQGTFTPDASEMFYSENIGPVIVLGSLQFAVTCGVAALVLYVDIVSVGAIFVAKSIITPYFRQIWDDHHAKKNSLTLWFILPSVPMLICCIIVVIFASKKRMRSVRQLL
jgi:hypothetical protein